MGREDLALSNPLQKKQFSVIRRILENCKKRRVTKYFLCELAKKVLVSLQGFFSFLLCVVVNVNAAQRVRLAPAEPGVGNQARHASGARCLPPQGLVVPKPRTDRGQRAAEADITLRVSRSVGRESHWRGACPPEGAARAQRPPRCTWGVGRPAAQPSAARCLPSQALGGLAQREEKRF